MLCSVVAMALYRYFQASEKSSCKLPDPRGPLSRLIPSSSIVSARESAECVGKQGEHSEWAKGTTLFQARSRTEGRISAGRQQSTSWLRLPGTRLLGEVGGASTARRRRSSKIKSRKVCQGLSAKILVLENF